MPLFSDALLRDIQSGAAPTNTFTVHQLIDELRATRKHRDQAYGVIERVWLIADEHEDYCCTNGCPGIGYCFKAGAGEACDESCSCISAPYIEALDSLDMPASTRKLRDLTRQLRRAKADLKAAQPPL